MHEPPRPTQPKPIRISESKIKTNDWIPYLGAPLGRGLLPHGSARSLLVVVCGKGGVALRKYDDADASGPFSWGVIKSKRMRSSVGSPPQNRPNAPSPTAAKAADRPTSSSGLLCVRVRAVSVRAFALSRAVDARTPLADEGAGWPPPPFQSIGRFVRSHTMEPINHARSTPPWEGGEGCQCDGASQGALGKGAGWVAGCSGAVGAERALSDDDDAEVDLAVRSL